MESHSSGRGKSKIKVPAELVSSEASLLCGQMAIVSSHGLSSVHSRPLVTLCPNLLSSSRAESDWRGAHPNSVTRTQ